MGGGGDRLLSTKNQRVFSYRNRFSIVSGSPFQVRGCRWWSASFKEAGWLRAKVREAQRSKFKAASWWVLSSELNVAKNICHLTGNMLVKYSKINIESKHDPRSLHEIIIHNNKLKSFFSLVADPHKDLAWFKKSKINDFNEINKLTNSCSKHLYFAWRVRIKSCQIWSTLHKGFAKSRLLFFPDNLALQFELIKFCNRFVMLK